MCSCKKGLHVVMFRTWIFLFLVYETYAMGELTKCEKVEAMASWRDHNTVVETSLKTLSGTWISEGCETRPGPEYVLRAYTFNPEGTYNLIQHHYWDDSCSSPKLTVISHGRLTLRNSLVQPEASNGLAKPTNITVIPQDSTAAEELNQLVSEECPGQYWKSWRRNQEHLVYDHRQERRGTFNLWSHSYQAITNQHPLNKPDFPQISGDISCLGSLKWAFNELKLLKIQLRPLHNVRKSPKLAEMELLLGDIHSNKKRREFYSPTSFQLPLFKQTKGENITVGKLHFLVKNPNTLTNLITSQSPPHLIEKPHLPPYIWGDWVSTRCEVRPLDVYLLRHFTFHESDHRWVGHHKFFSDPFCTYPKFIITATGHFTLVGPSETMKGVSDIDFQIERATLTALDHRIITEMRLPGLCGLGEWRVNVPKELATTNGCVSLGVFIPSVRFDVVKVEMDYKGSWLLFLGQADTNNLPQDERPTAFQLPMVKCGEKVSFTEDLRERLGREFYFGGGNALGGCIILIITSLLFLLL
ncbi:protein APCDD1-like isoform X1 [Tribolium castaneum]